MLDTVFTNITEGSLYNCLEIAQSENGETYRLLKVKKTKKELSIHSFFELGSLEEVVEHVDTNAPLLLCVDTANVLSKQLENIPSAQDAALVNEAFPNLDTGNIYWELTQKSSLPIVTIARKEYIDSLLVELEKYNIHPFQITLGLSGINSITPYIVEEEIRLAKYVLQLNDSSMVTISRYEGPVEPIEYMINGLSISNRYLLGFAQILEYIGKKESIGNLNALNDQFNSSFKNKRLFQMVGRGSLVFFIGMLVINFLFYNHYFEKVDNLNSELLANGSKKEQLLQLHATVQKKQERVELYTLVSGSKATLYLDRFAQKVPGSVTLEQLNFQPLEKTVQKNKPIELNHGVLSVSGVSRDVNAFSEWITDLETFDWIQNVETSDYDYLDKETSRFLLKIEFHED
ncbi:hypothetical protein MAR621_03064 [Maribacter dokdonensis]|mgnify:FL=1|nr:hypothetical protein MAR621_03064 [Maribacter dokdonensis]